MRKMKRKKNLPDSEVIPVISLRLVGKDIANKTLTLKSDSLGEYSSTTGSAGGCTVKNIKAGTYTVSIGESVMDTITVSSENIEFEITIE